VDPFTTLSGLQSLLSLSDRVRGHRVFFERPQVWLCNWGHWLGGSNERGTWHLDVRTQSWTPDARKTTVQNVRGKVKGQKLLAWNPNALRNISSNPFSSNRAGPRRRRTTCSRHLKRGTSY